MALGLRQKIHTLRSSIDVTISDCDDSAKYTMYHLFSLPAEDGSADDHPGIESTKLPFNYLAVLAEITYPLTSI